MKSMLQSLHLPILFFLLFSTSVFGDGILYASPGSEKSEVQTLTLDGLKFLFDFDFEKANEKFTAASSLDPSHPRPPLARALAPLWKYFASRDALDYDTAVDATTEAIESGQRYLDRAGTNGGMLPKDRADALACIGTAYGYRAFAHSLNKSLLKAAWDGRKSYSYLAEAIEADHNCYDAYLSLGILHYGTSFIPKALRWIVSILGIEADRDRGMKEIELAAKKGVYTATEAKYYLAQFTPWYSGDFTKSEKLMAELVREHPGNTVFLYTKGFLALRQNDVGTALPTFLRMKQAPRSFFSDIDRFADLRIGDCYFRLGEYTKAKESFEAFLEGHDLFQFVAMAAYFAGLSDEMMGNRTSALVFYRRAAFVESKHGEDVYATRHAARFLLVPLTSLDSLLVVARSAHRLNQHEKAITTYGTIAHSGYSNAEQSAEAIYGIGECLKDLGRPDEAAAQFRQLQGRDVGAEKWVLPWAQFMLGEIAVAKGDRTSAKRCFTRVLSYDDYDSRNWLEFRSEQELEKLNAVKQ